MLLDHDTLFTARWEAEELRRFAVLDLLPNTLSTESLGSMEVETDETQPCGSLPAITVWCPIAKLNWHGLCVRGPA